jgi:hypothetical protein
MNHIIPRLIPRNQYIYNHIEKLYKKNIFIIWKKISISEWYDTFNNHTTTWLLFSLKNELLLYMTYHIYIFKEKLLKSTRKLNTSIQKKKKNTHLQNQTIIPFCNLSSQPYYVVLISPYHILKIIPQRFYTTAMTLTLTLKIRKFCLGFEIDLQELL